jgi:hypothetical protein
MNRFLTLASGGLFATGLAILPISAFAQQTNVVGKTAVPMTQTSSTDAKIAAPGAKTDAGTKQAVVAKDASTHHVKHVVTPAAGGSANATKVAAPMANAGPGAHPSSSVQPKTETQSKS